MIFIVLGILKPNITKKEKLEEKRIKISLKEMPKKEKKSGEIKKTPQDIPIAPPMPKGKQLKELIKKEVIIYDKKKIKKQKKVNKKTIYESKPKISLKTKPKYEVFNPFAKLDNNTSKNKPIKKQHTSPYAWMSEDKSLDTVKKEIKKTAKRSSISQNIKELYGDKFGKLTPGQQKYIIDNQEIMRRITQQILNRVARVNLPKDINVNRSNVIEFYLHTNGDMTDFKFIQKSGYYVLDDTTKETIEYAYSRYPRPSEKTLIRYNIYYNLARY
ncbi:MAG: hypothetical protein COA33_007325 [Fluviicola sp.]|nr:hypothetical protein [Fluviicola sp.]